jgi:hypothetical protein
MNNKVVVKGPVVEKKSIGLDRFMQISEMKILNHSYYFIPVLIASPIKKQWLSDRVFLAKT